MKQKFSRHPTVKILYKTVSKLSSITTELPFVSAINSVFKSVNSSSSTEKEISALKEVVFIKIKQEISKIKTLNTFC